jgi:hypothetical protein
VSEEARTPPVSSTLLLDSLETRCSLRGTERLGARLSGTGKGDGDPGRQSSTATPHGIPDDAVSPAPAAYSVSSRPLALPG